MGACLHLHLQGTPSDPLATALSAADDGTDVFVRAIKHIKKGEVRRRAGS
jgi:hypothetical protein